MPVQPLVQAYKHVNCLSLQLRTIKTLKVFAWHWDASVLLGASCCVTFLSLYCIALNVCDCQHDRRRREVLIGLSRSWIGPAVL